MDSSGGSPDQRERPRQHQQLQMAPHVWPTVAGAGVAFAVAAHERLIWPQLIGCVLVALVVASLVAVLPVSRLCVEVDVPDRVMAGEPFETVLRVANRGAWARRSVVVRHRWRSRRRLVPELVALVDVVEGRGEAVVRSWRTPLARGAADVADVEIEIAVPFGFFSRTSKQLIRQPLLVLPASSQAIEFAANAGVLAGAATGATSEADVHGVREWRSGDQINQVHWRSVLRTGRMTVLDREGRSAGTVVVLVMAPPRRRRPVKDPAFESAVSTAAATVVEALRHGIATCVVAQTPNFGFRHLGSETDVLESFARIEAADMPSDELLAHALAHVAHGGVLLVVSAKSTPAQWRSRVFDAAAAAGAEAIDVGVMPQLGPTVQAPA